MRRARQPNGVSTRIRGSIEHRALPFKGAFKVRQRRKHSRAGCRGDVRRSRPRLCACACASEDAAERSRWTRVCCCAIMKGLSRLSRGALVVLLQMRMPRLSSISSPPVAAFPVRRSLVGIDACAICQPDPASRACRGVTRRPNPTGMSDDISCCFSRFRPEHRSGRVRNARRVARRDLVERHVGHCGRGRIDVQVGNGKSSS